MGCLCSKGAYVTTYEDIAGSKKIALESPGRLGCRFAGIKFAHDGVENSKRHRGSGKLVLVDDAYNKLTTYLYDQIQAMQNDIAREAIPSGAVFGWGS